MIVRIKLNTEYGEYNSLDMDVTDEEYLVLREASKTFFERGIDMETPDGFMVFPPIIVQKSILTLIRHEQ